VRQWAQKGLIEARTTAGGHRRFAREAVIDFARRMAMTLPEGFAAAPGIRVLVVDDDRQLNDMLVALIGARCQGVAAAPAYDAFDAGCQVQRFKPTLVLLEIAMPGLDAGEVCRRLTADAQGQSIRVIAMTRHPTPGLEQRIVAAGAERLMKKPFTTAELLQACGFAATETVQRRDESG
jgi:CheY-like chemotaxis protein